MNPSETPNLVVAHQDVIANIDNEAIFNKESVAHFKVIESGITFHEEGVEIHTPDDFDLSLGNNKIPASYAFTNRATYSPENRIIRFVGDPKIWVIPTAVHETFESEISGSTISSNFLVTKVGSSSSSLETSVDSTDNFDTLLLLRVGNGINKPGSTDELGKSIQFAIQRDATSDNLSFYRFIEEPKTREAVVVQQVVRKDPAEDSGEVVDARLEVPGGTLTIKHFKKLDDSIPEEANLISELRLELKKAADAKKAQA
jgi:hypothetical protein